MNFPRCRLSIPALFAILSSAGGSSAAIIIQALTYKKSGNLEITLAVHRDDDQHLRPLVVWIHGGALIYGGRHQVSSEACDLEKAGYWVVSIDY